MDLVAFSLLFINILLSNSSKETDIPYLLLPWNKVKASQLFSCFPKFQGVFGLSLSGAV